MANTNISTNVKDSFLGKSGKFLRETWLELRKTAWPTKDELTKMTCLVLAAVAVVTIWIGGLDAFFGWATKNIIGY